jgi:hypothetical protein
VDKVRQVMKVFSNKGKIITMKLRSAEEELDQTNLRLANHAQTVIEG